MRKGFEIFVILVSFMLSLSFVFAVAPSGATVTPGTSSSAAEDPAGSVDAIAGNVTELNIFGYSTTQAWQGYFGNVSGAIRLADASNNVLYNWSLASPQGEVYASTSDTITWGSVACMGSTDALEASLNIASDDVDGIDETFNLNNHDSFYTNNIFFNTGDCNNTKVYNNVGVGTFDEVLLTDGTETIYASLLLEDVVGFDGATHDFEMLVPEDGHGTDTSVTTYYFWVEIE